VVLVKAVAEEEALRLLVEMPASQMEVVQQHLVHSELAEPADLAGTQVAVAEAAVGMAVAAEDPTTTVVARTVVEVAEDLPTPEATSR
jgi:hypothetical protein